MKKRVLLSILILFISIAFTGCGSSGSSSDKKENPVEAPLNQNTGQSINPDVLKRANGDTQIALLVTFLNPIGQEKEGYISFEVWLNNHKINLASFPMTQNAKLYDLKGNLISAQPLWEIEGTPPHIKGRLHFETEMELSKIGGLKLVIQNIGVTPKLEFTWEAKYLAF